MDKSAIRRSFDRAASSYDAAAFLQKEVARRLDERLEMMKISPGTILDAGCGTGHGIPLLRARYPEASVFGLDLAHSMLMQAQVHLPHFTLLKKLGHTLGLVGGAGNGALLCADVEHLPLHSNCLEMVWSNLTLQWIDDLEATFRQFRRALKPDGLFVFSTFGPDTLKELREAFRGLDGYAHVNRFVDMHDVGDQLVNAGFKNPVMEMEHLTLTYLDLKDLLSELKSIGAHTVLRDRRSGLMGRGVWQQLLKNYEHMRQEGRLPATYEIVYGHAWVGEQEMLEDGRQIVRFKMDQRKVGQGA